MLKTIFLSLFLGSSVLHSQELTQDVQLHAEQGVFWHGKTFSNSTSDALGQSNNSFSFDPDGRKGRLSSSGSVGSSSFQSRSEFNVMEANSSQIIIQYTSTTDASMKAYIVGKKETIKLNPDNQTLVHGGKIYKQ